MKRLITLTISICFFLQLGYTQSVPQGMKYQAVARDLKGNVLSEQTIFLKISLYNDPVRKYVSYEEVHKLTTNALGLFDLTIGGGQPVLGKFDLVPWSNEEIWIEVAVQASETLEYITISNSQMLSVPYAFHAATASQISGINRNGNGPGIPSQTWSLFGNSNSDPTKDKLGTTDNADLVIVTNNIERMRIFANGDIEMKNSLTIGKDLTVKENVYLNTVRGETTNYGDFTVENQSNTLLSGRLTVDLATDLNSSLNVDGITNLNSSLFVNNMSPTVLTGTLLVNKDATFKQHVLLDNPALSSTLPTNGALVVNGGVGIGENLNVAGESKFGGPVQFAGQVSITDATESTSTTTGALKVTGGVGIGLRLNVGGATGLGSTLGVTGATSLGSTLAVTGASTLNNTATISGITSVTNVTESSTSANGALVVSGGAGIAKNLNVGGTTVMNKELTVKGTGALGGHVAAFENSSNGNGISIKVGAGTPHNSNNFVTFLNNGGTTVGRIEGENGAADLLNNYAYQDKLGELDWEIFFTTVDVAAATLDEIQAAVDLVGASTSSTACAGLGVCVTAPVPSLIVAAAAGLIVATANLVAASANLVMAIDDKASFASDYATHFGVTYASGAGDYAEYLPKLNQDEKFFAGDVVGMKNGYITKSTIGADRIMVISHNPIVLGKLPANGREDLYEMVAFLGQIPTKVMGDVHQGDYILCNGFNNGLGVAKNPKNMQMEDYNKILGVAWESAVGNKINMVNVAVGLNTNDLSGLIMEQAEIIKKQAESLDAMNQQISQTNSVLAELVPGFKESIQKHTTVTLDNSGNRTATQHEETADHFSVVEPSHTDIMYFDITTEQLEEGIKMAEKMSVQAGVDLSTHPFWSRLSTDPSYKMEIFNDIKGKLEHAYHSHEAVNATIGK